MIEVNNTPIIVNQINALQSAGVKEIIIVAGYKHEILIKTLNEKFLNLKFVINYDYGKTNNMFSTYLAKSHLYDNEFILMNADVFFDKSVIKDLITYNQKNIIVCDSSIYEKENMKIIIKNGRVSAINKNITSIEFSATSIDVYRFTKQSGNIFFNLIEDYINNYDKNSWTELIIDKLLNIDIFEPMYINYKWREIDNIEDLNIAKEIFK